MESEQVDAGVLRIVWLLGLIQTGLNFVVYRPLAWLFGRPGRGHIWKADVVVRSPAAGLYFNYGYAIFWLGITVAALVGIATVGRTSCLADLLVAVVLLRIAEVIVWQLKLLLDRAHRLILAPERNLLLLIIDSSAAITGVAVLLRRSAGLPTASDGIAWLDALSIFTLNGRVPTYRGPWAALATVVGTLVGLALGTAALALLLGIVQEKFTLGTGPYTGPRRIGKPRRGPELDA